MFISSAFIETSSAHLSALTRYKIANGGSLRRFVLCSNLLNRSDAADKERAQKAKRDELIWFENLMEELEEDEENSDPQQEEDLVDILQSSPSQIPPGPPKLTPKSNSTLRSRTRGPRTRATGERLLRKRACASARASHRHIASTKLSMKARFDPSTAPTLAPAGFQFIIPAGLNTGYLLGLTSRGLTVRKAVEAHSDRTGAHSKELCKILNHTFRPSPTRKPVLRNS